MSHARTVLLLTATIDPRDMQAVRRTDPVLRESDYRTVLKRLIQETDFPIVWCENSGHSLQDFRARFEKVSPSRLEILQFVSCADSQKGKGWGELETEEYAFKHSVLLAGADYVAKLTGRYFVENMSTLLAPLRTSGDHFVLADFRPEARYTFSGFFVGTARFYREYLFKQKDFLDDSINQTMEVALSRAIKESVVDGNHYKRFSETPQVTGISGTWNIAVDAKDPNQIIWSWPKVRMRIKFYLKALKKKIWRAKAK